MPNPDHETVWKVKAFIKRHATGLNERRQPLADALRVRVARQPLANVGRRERPTEIRDRLRDPLLVGAARPHHLPLDNDWEILTEAAVWPTTTVSSALGRARTVAPPA